METSNIWWHGAKMTEIAAIILAAGKGTRMKSDLHKVLHPIAGRPMLMHLMASVDALNPTKKVVVVGSGKEQLEAALAGTADFAVQEPQLGTGHAVQMAEAALAGFDGDVLILPGDVPFISTATMQAMLDRLHAPDAPAVVVLGFRPADTLKYGRIIAENGIVSKMVEHKDATQAEREVRLCNGGQLAARARDLFPLLERVDPQSNAAKEYYLVDIVNIANADGRTCAVVDADAFETAGINSRSELAMIEGEWQARRRTQAMDDGATLIAPASVWLAYDTELGQDVTVQPNVVFKPGVSVGSRSQIDPHLIIPEGSKIPPDTLVTWDNMNAFQFLNETQSANWTGRFALSERARNVVECGPAAIASLTETIRALELSQHNGPPDLVEDGEFASILPNLKELRFRLNDLIHAIEHGEGEARIEALGGFYREKIAPWLQARLADAASGMNNLVSNVPVLASVYFGCSLVFKDEATVAALLGAVSGAVGATARK